MINTRLHSTDSRFSSLLSRISLLSFLIFYLFFALFDGVVMSVDSPGYIDMSFSREPLYPLLLAFFRFFGEDYLQYVVIFQSLLMAVIGWALTDFLRKRLCIPPFYSLFLYLFPLATSLLCRFAAKRRSMYTNSILTEGIATSLYLLFILLLYRYILEKRPVFLLSSSMIVFLMISTRKQMFMLFPLLLLGILLAPVFSSPDASQDQCEKKRCPSSKAASIVYRFLVAVVISVGIIAASTFLDCCYNYFVRGHFQRHSSDNRFVTTMLFYNAERSDADYIEDRQIRQLFLEIYDVCLEKGYLGSQAEKGWLNEVSHFGDHYDHIQIDTLWPTILQQAGENLQTQDVALKDKETDRINEVIIRSLLPHKLPQLAHSLLNNFASGLITTVAQRKPVLIAYSVFVYIAFLFLFLRLFLRYQKQKKQEDLLILLFALLTAVGIVSNVGLVSAVIFCQTRYTIYNMPLFYLAGTLLLYANLTPHLSDRTLSNRP